MAEAPRRRAQLTEPAAPAAAAVMAAFRLAGAPTALAPVAGAWSNRLYRLETTEGFYAVKELENPWDEPRFAQRLGAAWRFEQDARAAGIAAPEPIPAPGGACAISLERPGRGEALVRVHRWVDGVAAPAGPVSADVAGWAGQTLARLHGLAVAPADRSLFPYTGAATADRWPELVAAARRAGAGWADALERAGGAVFAIADLAAAAAHRPGDEVMSHADFDQRNVLLTPSGPVLCDWDVASPVVPRCELAGVALSLGAWVDMDVAREVVRAYRAAGGDAGAFAPPDLGPALMTGLDWIALNVEVALGELPAPAWRRERADGLVSELAASVPGRVQVALDVGAALNA
ncbi:MAG TPA: phosphotransferase [Gaiellales bacterium]